jgi:hypothetical protein
MPTIFKFFGMQFYFWSNEHEPVHIHVRKGRCLANFVIEPDIELIENKGFKPQELRLAENIIEENKDVIITNWKTCFNKQTLL